MATIINEILLGRPSTAEVLAQNETSKVNDSLTRNEHIIPGTVLELKEVLQVAARALGLSLL
jgi:hypothetical protein